MTQNLQGLNWIGVARWLLTNRDQALAVIEAGRELLAAQSTEEAIDALQALLVAVRDILPAFLDNEDNLSGAAADEKAVAGELLAVYQSQLGDDASLAAERRIDVSRLIAILKLVAQALITLAPLFLSHEDDEEE